MISKRIVRSQHTLVPLYIEYRAHYSGADKLGQQPIVSMFISGAAGDDGRMDAELLCQGHHRHRSRILRNFAGFPGGFRCGASDNLQPLVLSIPMPAFRAVQG